MVSFSKIIIVVACSVVLGLSVFGATQATGSMGHDPCADRKGGEPNLVACSEELRKGIETIKGEVLRVEGANYVVERFDGKEVQLHIDKDTKLSGKVSQGDRIEAKVGDVNNQIHVLALRQLK